MEPKCNGTDCPLKWEAGGALHIQVAHFLTNYFWKTGLSLSPVFFSCSSLVWERHQSWRAASASGDTSDIGAVTETVRSHLDEGEKFQPGVTEKTKSERTILFLKVQPAVTLSEHKYQVIIVYAQVIRPLFCILAEQDGGKSLTLEPVAVVPASVQQSFLGLIRPPLALSARTHTWLFFLETSGVPDGVKR